MKYLIFLMISALLSTHTRAIAQNAGPKLDCPNAFLAQVDAAKLLSQVQQAYNAVTDLSANFSQESTLAALDFREQSSGHLLYSRPGRMRWSYKKPEVQEFIIRENTLWLYQPKENQVLIDDFSSVLLSQTPIGFLMGVGDLNRDFTLKTACKDKSSAVLKLAPKASGNSKDENLQSLTLGVKLGTFLPYGAQVKDLAGNTTSILLTDLVKDSNLQEEKFSPRFPTGVDVNDRRRH
jgi:outer membrane lipoprotein carrier protein